MRHFNKNGSKDLETKQPAGYIIGVMWKLAIRRLIVIVFLVLALLFAGRLWYLSKDGFSINRIHYPLAASENDPNEDFVRSLLVEPYHYIGRGRQCYAFASADGQYVMKIPRFDRYFLPFFWKFLPFSFLDSCKKSIFDERQSRLQFTLESFRIAAIDLREQTAVLYLHLHRTKSLPRLVLYDRLHRPYRIDLNQTAFILQKKHEIMMPLCVKALADNDREKAKEMFMAFLNIIDVRAQKGILNRDPSFLKNFGWDGEKSIQIDIGSFWKRSDLSGDELYSFSLRDGTSRFREWLKQLDPEMCQWFECCLEERLQAKR
jgi:hypothetical protein